VKEGAGATSNIRDTSNLDMARSDTVSMFTSTSQHADMNIEVLHTANPERTSQDRWLVQPRRRQVRVAAIDGVTPWRTTAPDGTDGAVWAATVTAETLALSVDLRTAFWYSNTFLHDPATVPSRRQAMAAVAAADCQRAGNHIRWQAVVAADCEVWTSESWDDVPQLVAGGQFIQEHQLRIWNDLLAEHGQTWSFDEQLAVEAELLEHPNTQICHAVGRYRSPVFNSNAGISNILIVASDGARLGPAAQRKVAAGDIVEWVEHIGKHPVHDDITCLLVSPAGSSQRQHRNRKVRNQ
jgi:hypothetical protein